MQGADLRGFHVSDGLLRMDASLHTLAWHETWGLQTWDGIKESGYAHVVVPRGREMVWTKAGLHMPPWHEMQDWHMEKAGWHGLLLRHARAAGAP